MFITYKTGNLLEDNATLLVNTVNTKGVMGKGLAADFDNTYPLNSKLYKEYCKLGKLRPGGVLFNPLDNSNTRIIANLATKDHWRYPTKFDWITSGLTVLRQYILDNGITSVAISLLGAGNGGLNPDSSRIAIEGYLRDIPNLDLSIYLPETLLNSYRVTRVDWEWYHIVATGRFIEAYLTSSYLYYHALDKRRICDDSLFDRICRYLLVNWDRIDSPYKSIVDYNSLQAGTGFDLKLEDYPASIIQIANLMSAKDTDTLPKVWGFETNKVNRFIASSQLEGIPHDKNPTTNLTDEVKSIIDKEGECNLLICGSRSIDEYYLVYHQLLPIMNHSGIDTSKLFVVQGDARGVDLTAKYVAHSLGVSTKDYPANWDIGKHAGFLRNAEMVKVADATLAIMPKSGSSGTKHSIKLSKRKGVPVMTVTNELPKGLTEDELADYITIRHLTNTLTFPVNSSPLEYLTKLEQHKLSDRPLVDYIGAMSHDLKEVPTHINNMQLEGYKELLTLGGYSLSVLALVHSHLLAIRDIITPKVVNKLYVKLDTGGFSGYRSDIRRKGEDYYNVLRITIGVNDIEPIDIIIKPDDENAIDPKTKEIHISSGLWAKSITSEIDLDKARNMVSDYLIKNGVRPNNFQSNVNTHLVGFNTEFLRAFLGTKFPNVIALTSRADIDVNKVSKILELNGSYNKLPVVSLYRDNPKDYIQKLRDVIGYFK